MPWDKLMLPPIHFGIKQPILIKPFQIVKRIAHNDQFKLIEDNAKWIDSRSEENTYSLNIKNLKLLKTQIEEKLRNTSPWYKNSLKFSSLP
jgi:carboxyl-terminal processing protease